ncbi:hypothetical protein AGRA3207_001575 [Actinomadura graeca]|uniref:DUF6745 domain-containing protein n=1 Tax=Actinomadura graeca TaxID=2750812 RepID=A0ABX8QPT0_9ACTN|nr:hypothetical protein [Actinomadura graeca]QXJ20800.1 hypothetical protein AGRA3207_001575 [Actinomadura graeca]
MAGEIEPLSDQDRAEIAAGLRRAYHASLRHWPRRVIWVESPQGMRPYHSWGGRQRALTARDRIRALCWRALSILASTLCLYLVFLPFAAIVYVALRTGEPQVGLLGASLAKLSWLEALYVYSGLFLFVWLCCGSPMVTADGGYSEFPFTFNDQVKLHTPRKAQIEKPPYPFSTAVLTSANNGDIKGLQDCLFYGGPGRAFACATFRDLAIVVEPPSVMHTETLPDGTTRPHRDDGPALQWPGGEDYFFLHGTLVPKELFDGEWGLQQFSTTRNSELRRLAIERMGWETFISRTGLEPLAESDDPANPGALLRLYDIPNADARLLVMRNGSPDRSGAHREYAEPVPPHLDDPVEAAAWQYGCPVEVYRRLERRT